MAVIASVQGAWAQSAALYKDGKKVLDFEAIVAPPAGPEAGLVRFQTLGARFLERAFGKQISGKMSVRRAYIERVMECRKLVDALGEGSRPPAVGSAELEQLLTQVGPLREAHESHMASAGEIRTMLEGAGFTAERRARQAEAQEKYRVHGERVLDLLTRLNEANQVGNVAEVQQVLAELDRFLPVDGPLVSSPPALAPKPRVVPMEVRPPAIVDPGAEPPRDVDAEGSRTGPVASYDPADLTETIDVRFTSAIVALAAELDHSPARMYEYVRNNVEFECYLGSRKGSTQTLEHVKGNDYDQASLLIALLRSSGIPARYAKGRVKISAAALDAWLGFQDRYTAAVMLNSAGLQVALYGTSIDDITAIAFEHVWVETWIPYTNYRGAPNDTTGSRWVPMDPVFSEHQFSQPFYVYDELNLDAEQFVQNFYSTVSVATPLQALEQLMLATLASNHPGAVYEDMVQSRTAIRETDGIVPGTLPFELLSSGGTFSVIPSNMRYRVRFHIWSGGATLDYTTSTPELASKQLTISYVGATPADQAAIDAAGGIWFLPDPYLVDLVPVLRIDGCEVTRGTGAIMTGTYQYSDMYFTTPTGASNQVPVVYNYILAGNYHGVGIDTEDAYPSPMGVPATVCGEEYLGQVVHQAALTYLNNVNAADDSLAALMHISLTNDVSEAIVENTITVWVDFWGYPVELEWTGMLVDADRKIIGPYSIHGDDLVCDFMRIGGADGSFQEHYLFESVFGEEAISTMKILALANDLGIGVCKITSSIAADCPGISQPPEVIDYINQYLAAGYHVIIPKAFLTYYNWTGTAWIAMDPATCSAGYIIYGGQNSMRETAGGATVQTWTISYRGLQCLNPSGTITVDPPGDFYCATNPGRWTFTVNALKYIGKNASGTPCQQLHQENKQFTVTNYTIKQLADDPRFGPGEYVFRVGGPAACAGCTPKEKVVTIVRLQVNKVEFTSDHGLLRDYDADYVGSGATVYSPRGWIKKVANNPVTHTKGTNVTTTVTLRVEPSGLNFSLTGEGPIGALDFHKSGLTSTPADQAISVTSDAALPATVDVLNHSIAWSITVSGAVTCGNESSGPHKIYVLWNGPGSGPTVKRVDWACNIAKGANSVSTAAESFRNAIAMDPGYSPVDPGDNVWELDTWKFLDMGEYGDCITLAKLASEGLKMTGIPADHRWSFPTADGSPGFAPVSGNSCRSTARSAFMYQGESFDAKLVYPGNNFEGFFTVSDPGIKAYTVYLPGGPFENQTYYYLEVLQFAAGVGGDQFWVWDCPNRPAYECTKNGVTVRNWEEVPGAAHLPVPAVP